MKKYTVLLTLLALLLAGCVSENVTQTEQSSGSTSFAEPQASSEEVLEASDETSGKTSDEASFDTSRSDEEDPLEKPSWELGETFRIFLSANYGYSPKLTLIDSTQELQAFIQEMQWDQVPEEPYNTYVAKLADHDEAFFEEYTLALVLFASGSPIPETAVEDVCWLADGEDGKTRAEILIRVTDRAGGVFDTIYIEHFITFPISKAASMMCDELNVRYLHSYKQEDGHVHDEPADSVQNGEPMTYQKGTPVEITRKGAVWQSESQYTSQLRTDVLPDDELAYRLMEMLEGLAYLDTAVCSCEIELEDKYAWVPPLCVAGEYYITDDFVRCSRGQVYLTSAQKELVQEVRSSIKKTERGFYRAYDEAVFYLGYEETPLLFADGNTVLLTTAKQWETLMSEIEPAFTFALLNEYDGDVQKMLADYSLILYLIPAEDSSYYSMSRKLWDAESNKATIFLHHDANGKSEREGYARLICIPVQQSFASELVSIEFEILQVTFRDYEHNNGTYTESGRHGHAQSYETLTIGQIPDYPDDLSVTVEHDGKTYTVMGETAKKLMSIMDTLHYQTYFMCLCDIDDLDEVYLIDSKYTLAMSDYLARKGKEQVFLTASQTNKLRTLLDEIVN